MKLIVLTYSEIDDMLKVLIFPLIQSKKQDSRWKPD